MDRRRIFAAASLAIAEAVAGKPVQLAGYAMRWNSLSNDRGGFKVRLAPGSAFAATPTQALYAHDRAKVLGTTANGSLRITPDDVGLRVEIDLPDVTYAHDAATLVRDGYVAGMSFGLSAEPTFRAIIENGQKIAEFTRFSFDEVSVLGHPSFTDTSIAAKQFADLLPRPAIDRQRQQLQRFTATKFRLAGVVARAK